MSAFPTLIPLRYTEHSNTNNTEHSNTNNTDNIGNIPTRKPWSNTIKNSLKTFIYDGASPCPWADYLKCIPQNTQSVDETLDSVKKYMTNFSGEHNQSGGAGFNYAASLDSTIEMGKNILKQIDEKEAALQIERMKAAAAISYITRLFVLGMEDDVDTLRDYARKQNPPLELDDVMYKLVTYIKNTRYDNV